MSETTYQDHRDYLDLPNKGYQRVDRRVDRYGERLLQEAFILARNKKSNETTPDGGPMELTVEDIDAAFEAGVPIQKKVAGKISIPPNTYRQIEHLKQGRRLRMIEISHHLMDHFSNLSSKTQ